VYAAPNGAYVYAVHNYNEPNCCGGPNRPPSESSPQTSSVPSNSVTAINVATLQVGASFTPQPVAIGLNFAGPMVIGGNGKVGYVYLGLYWPPGGGYLYAVNLPQMTLNTTLNPPPNFNFGSNMAISANGDTLVDQCDGDVLNEPCGATLAVIDTATNAVTQTISNVPGNLSSVSPNGDAAYVVASAGGAASNLETVNLQTDAITTVVANEAISQVLYPPGGKDIFLLLSPGSVVSASPEGSAPNQLIDAGEPSNWLAVTSNGGTLYSAGKGGIWAFSTTTGLPVGQLVTSSNVAAFAVSPGGGTLYAVLGESLDLLIFNVSTGVIEATIPLPTECSTNPAANLTSAAIALSPAGKEAYVVVDCNVNTITPGTPAVAIDLQTRAVTGRIAGTEGPALAVNPTSGYLYVSSSSGSVEVINVSTNQTIGTIPISANSIAFSPDGTTAYIAGSQAGVGGVAVVDASTLAVTDFIAGANGSGAESIAVTPDGTYVYVGGSPGRVISTQTLQVVGQFQSSGPIAIY